MLKLVHDRDREEPQPKPLPAAGGALALLPGPVLWVSAEGRVVDANLAAIDLMLDVTDAAFPLRQAIAAVLSDGEARLRLNGKTYQFQVAALSIDTASASKPGVIAVGQAIDVNN